jgi:hypothetical protein
MHNLETKKRRIRILDHELLIANCRALKATGFVLLWAVFAIASAHETGVAHQELPPPWPYHALLVSTGFIVLFAAMLTARYMKNKRWWLRAHKSLGLLGAFITLAGFATAVFMVRTYIGTLFIPEMHAYLGFTIAAMALFTPFLGFMQFRTKDKRMHLIHRWAGRITIVLMLINIIGGWLMISSGTG